MNWNDRDDEAIADRKTLNLEAGSNQERGAIGYILLWLLGVPASLLFLIFLVRGCT